ncbi:MAG: DNA starvation/stationary phase protection protein [Thermomicrobiales bacterium]|nr:DNA starvation/stationary phase protection protein [Thermomicrobiales bacterium]
MSTESTPTHLPPLGGHSRETVGAELQATLFELVDLSLVGKQLHWSVTGAHFRELHLMLDELVDSWRDLADTVAERAVAIGSFPDGQAEVVAEGSGMAAVARGPIDDAAVVREVARRLAETNERARERMDRLADLDLASQDVLIEVVRALEKQLWMIRAQFPHV